MLKLFAFASFLNSFSHCSVIDYSLTKVLSINDTESYFGYSILLQRGNPPIAIIGAPRKKRNNENTGSVYQCNLNTLSCEEYYNILNGNGIHPPNKNGDFLGSVLDGDDVAGSNFFTCAPRLIQDAKNYHIRGKCFSFINSNKINERPSETVPLGRENAISSHNGLSYYDAAYGEAGFAIKYLKNGNELLIGAPGKTMWIGALVKLRNSVHDIFSVATDFDSYSYTYHGYAVSWGKFIKGSQTVWYISGAPRGNKLKGNVVLFEYNNSKKFKVRHSLFGDEFGSYFGASLLVIHNDNGGDDLLVGAPTYSGKTWNQGCVYYYKNRGDGTFYPPVKLLGNSSNSQFGSVIAAMGDINLDSFQDCAISAPYEDNGMGAVYLYYGSSMGFSSSNFHRISPSNFVTLYSQTVKGFGMSVARGNDVDNNGHNDIVIGAYKSGVAFYFRTHSLFDINGTVTSNEKILTNTTTNFSINFCLTYTYRNKQKLNNTFITQLLLLDDRIINDKNITEVLQIESDKKVCRTHTVQLQKIYSILEPLDVTYRYKQSKSEIFQEETLKIPVSSGCGDDNICQTDVSITATVGNITNLVIGLANELQVNVIINNVGEPAYQMKLYLTVPSDVSLINLRECYLDGSYSCMISQPVTAILEKKFLLDLTNLQPNRSTLSLDFRVESLGVNNNPDKGRLKMNIPVLLQSGPYVDGHSVPNSIVLSKKKNVFEINHNFLLGNQGPSPLNLNLRILVPQLQWNNSDVIEIDSVEGISDTLPTECTRLTERSIDLSNIKTEPPSKNNSVTVSCFDQKQCAEILCKGGYVPKSSENIMFSLKLIIHTDFLRTLYQSTDSLIIVSTAYLNNGTTEIVSSSSTPIYGLLNNSSISLWIYVVSAIAGIILLLLIIFGLYKCNFFKRNYKEKLECEQAIMENNDADGSDDATPDLDSAEA